MLLLDLGVAILLITTIGFCVRLNKKIIELQRSKGELAKLFKQFDGVILRAENGVQNLKAITETSGKQCEETIERATELLDALTLLIRQGNKTHGVLEAVLQRGKLLVDEAHHTLDEVQSHVVAQQAVQHYVQAQHQNRQAAQQPPQQQHTTAPRLDMRTMPLPSSGTVPRPNNNALGRNEAPLHFSEAPPAPTPKEQ